MSWEEWIILVVFLAVMLFDLIRVRRNKRAVKRARESVLTTPLFCDHPGCPRPATMVVMDRHGRAVRACDDHIDPVVRKAIDPGFEAFGVAA